MAHGGTYYYLTDALGTVTAVTDQQGDVAFQNRYDAFGGLLNPRWVNRSNAVQSEPRSR